MYQIELKKGIQPEDSEEVIHTLKQFNPEAVGETQSG